MNVFGNWPQARVTDAIEAEKLADQRRSKEHLNTVNGRPVQEVDAKKESEIELALRDLESMNAWMREAIVRLESRLSSVLIIEDQDPRLVGVLGTARIPQQTKLGAFIVEQIEKLGVTCRMVDSITERLAL